MLPPPRSGPPEITTRVGSPPVCESITWIRCKADAFISTDSRGGQRGTSGDGVTNDRENLFTLGARDGKARRPHHLRSEACLRHRQLDVLDQLDSRVQVQQRRVPAVQLARLRPASRGSQIPERAV